MYYKRHAEKLIDRVSKTYPAVLITGPRQVGKSTVLKQMYPDYAYETLDDLNMAEAIGTDPLGYLKIKGTPFVIDEIQKVPSLFDSIKYVIDTEKTMGAYFLTGSQKFELMHSVSESLSGRISIINMLGLSVREITGDDFDAPFLPTIGYLTQRKPKLRFDVKNLWSVIHKGSMPALYENAARDWERYYADYVATYIERDVKSLSQVGDSLTFMQFMTALASRTGQLLNMNDIAKDVGVSAPTVKRWLSILQTSNIVYLLQPFSLNGTKRVVKNPKVYFTDTGLVCYLCRWLTVQSLMCGAQAGAIFETFVISEIIKSYYNAGKKPDIYYFRNTDGQEVDLVFYLNGTIYPVEIKKTSSPNVKDVRTFKTLATYFSEIPIGDGGVICTSEQLLPLGTNVKIIPVNYI